MKTRNVQKTGNMYYVYLPSKWCRDKKITVGSQIEMNTDSSGNLTIYSKYSERPEKNLKISVKEDDFYVLSKLVMACFLNPVRSFEINLGKSINKKEALHQKKLLSTTVLEIDEKRIYSEPMISINQPFSLFLVTIKKAKTMIEVMIEDYDQDFIEQMEEEIDWSNTMINKSVIGSLMHRRESSMKLIELHYLSLLSKYFERIIDHLIKIEQVDTNEKKFLSEVSIIMEEIHSLGKKILEKDPSFNHEAVIEFIKKIKALKVDETKIREVLIKTSLRHFSEVMIDWSITNLVEH